MRRGIFALLTLSVLIASCSASTQGDPAAEEATPQAAPSPTPIPVTYSDLSSLFEARVESGAWTVEEGLISTLELVAGQSSGEEFLAGAEFTSSGATGLLMNARNYLQTGTDESAKDEIRRLVSALVPSQEALDLYSTPAGAGNRPPGHAAQVDCRTLQAEGFPADRATQCFLRYEAALAGGGQVNIYFPEEWGDDEVQRQYLEATQQAITDSLTAYDGLGLTHRTLYVFFTLLDYRPASGASGLWYASADLRMPIDPATNCLLAIYPEATSAGTGRGLDVYKQILAHEIFHCYQFWNYNAASMGVPHSQNKWWVEGTAEYFGNFVYESVNAEYEYLPSFDRRSPFESIIDMDYQNFIFFQYLANEIGNAGILRLIESMPTAAGASQADALSAFPDIEELFHDFGRDYLDGQIMDASDSPIPGRPRLDGIVFDETFVDAIPPVDRFILQRFNLIFPGEHHFALEVGSEGADGSNGIRMGTGSAWVPMSFQEFDVACGSREMVLLTTTTAREGQYHLLVDVLVTDGPICDECLIGLWELDNGSYLAYWFASPAGSAEGVEYGGVTGLMWASYGEDGVVMNGWSDFTINYTKSFGGSLPDMDFAIVLNGSGRALYSVFGDTLTYSESVSDYAIVVNMNGSPVGSTGIGPDDFGGGFGGGPIRYVCTDSTLQFISGEFPQLNELIFLRAD